MMTKKALSFSIENILKCGDQRKTVSNEKEIEKPKLVHVTYEGVVWDRLQYDHTCNRTLLASYYGTHINSLTSLCKCENNWRPDDNFPEKLKVRRIGHPYKSRAPPKHKPCRNTFTQSQIIRLETLFKKTKYLTSAERLHVAKEINMTDSQLKTWYQNRRTKLKREINELREQRQQRGRDYQY